MRKLVVFNAVTLDGYFTGENGDISWAHTNPEDAEWNDFVAGNASGDGLLLFGRITYELMVSYWPTPLAAENDPVVAERINNLAKIVFSRTLDEVSWQNTGLVKSNLVTEVQKLKNESGSDMTILGSGTIVSQLAAAGLIDEYQIVVAPIVLGRGRTMFAGLPGKLPLKLAESRTFTNGNVFLRYKPG
ncbi:MAG: dihydrofolate reductase [Anaerolinea sp.]|nr:dihydrofolate reductase [Anaerolinea sp.]